MHFIPRIIIPWQGAQRCAPTILLSLFLLALPARAATYYVDFSGGNDSNNGTSLSAPWKTIAKVNSSTFQPGDSILFKSGEMWREQLNVPSSGAVGQPIIFGAYGSGAQPVITGSSVTTGWTTESQGAFKAYYVTQGVQSYVVTSDGTHLLRNSISKSTLAPGQFFWQSSGTRLYVRLPTDDAPSSHTLETGTRDYAGQISGQTNIVIQDLQLQGANSAVLYASGNANYLTLLNNTIQFGGDSIWKSCIILRGVSNAVISNNVVRYCYNNIIVSGYGPAANANNVIQANTVSYSMSFGIAVTDGCCGGSGPQGTIIQNNKVDHAGVSGIYLEFAGGASAASGTSILSNAVSYSGGGGISLYSANTGDGLGPTNTDVESNDVSFSGQTLDDRSGLSQYGAGTGTVFAYNVVHNGGTASTRSSGIMVDLGTPSVQVNYNIVYLNTNGCIAVGSNSATIYNTTCYHNNENGYDIGELNTFGSASDVLFKNNIAVASAGKHLVRTLTGNTFDHNVFYGGSAAPFEWGSANYSFVAWKTNSRQDANSINADPLITNPPTDMTLQSGSPALGAGAKPWL